MAERVFITGIGAVTPLGIGREALWGGALSGRRAVQQLDRFDPDPVPLESRGASQRLRSDRRCSIARRSSAPIASANSPSRRRSSPSMTRATRRAAAIPDFGIWIGSALGGVVYAERQYEAYQRGGLRAVHPMLALSVFGAASCCNVAIHFGLHGPSISNSNSCAAGAVAIGDAFRAVATACVAQPSRVEPKPHLLRSPSARSTSSVRCRRATTIRPRPAVHSMPSAMGL